MKKSLVSALVALAMVVGGVAPAAHATGTTFGVGTNANMPTVDTSSTAATLAWSLTNGVPRVTRTGNYKYLSSTGSPIRTVNSYLVACSNNLGATTQLGGTGCTIIYDQNGDKLLENTVTEDGTDESGQVTNAYDEMATNVWSLVNGVVTPNYNLTDRYLHLEIRITQLDGQVYFHRTAGERWGGPLLPSSSSSSSSSSYRVPAVPVFKQPKFEMPSKIEVDVTGKVKLSGKDMGVSSVLIGGVAQKIDVNSDAALVFDTTGLAKGVHDLVMKGAFGTYTVQKAIQVGEAVVTKVAAVSARQVGMAGGELSISGQGLEGTTQITMNGQVLEIVSKTDSKVTFKVPASTVASVNSIMIEGSFVPVIFKNAFSYTK